MGPIGLALLKFVGYKQANYNINIEDDILSSTYSESVVASVVDVVGGSVVRTTQDGGVQKSELSSPVNPITLNKNVLFIIFLTILYFEKLCVFLLFEGRDQKLVFVIFKTDHLFKTEKVKILCGIYYLKVYDDLTTYISLFIFSSVTHKG